MNMEQSAKRVNDARMLKSYIDTLLTQLYEDCLQQGNAVNDSFRRRIDEMKEAKTKLEHRHHEVGATTICTYKLMFIYLFKKKNKELL